ncbi:MAG TPA: hypothetical protein VJ983_03490, partial [candidate division Zixibacteria bacterium]|nr:hypothetical protein [candidate division Zixibacteria bacterium]
MIALVKSFTVLALVWVHVTGEVTSPTVSVQFSADSFYSMIVIPGGDTLNTSYFPPGFRFERPQNLEQHYSAYGIFCSRGADSVYRPLWMAELPYEKAPVTTLIQNQGKYVVMLDEWQNAGRGDNAVVIFDRHGWMIRNLSLTDMMPAERVAKFDRCAFGVWWRYDQQILQESDQLEIRMESNNDEVGPFSNLLVHEDYLRLDLKTGVVLSLKSNFQDIVDTYPDTCPGNPICKTSRYFRYLLNHPNPDIKARIDSLNLHGSPMDSLREVYACFANDPFWIAGAAMQLIGRPVTFSERG